MINQRVKRCPLSEFSREHATIKRHGRSVVRVSCLDCTTLNDVVLNGSLRHRFDDALHLDL